MADKMTKLVATRMAGGRTSEHYRKAIMELVAKPTFTASDAAVLEELRHRLAIAQNRELVYKFPLFLWQDFKDWLKKRRK